MDWITDNIAIGNYLDGQMASPDEVDAILCLITHCCSIYDERFMIENIPLIDGAGNDKRVFDHCIDFIDDIVLDGEKILVHCHAGRSRSVCIVARYFMVKKGLTRQQALARIEAKREIYLSPGIEEILQI